MFNTKTMLCKIILFLLCFRIRYFNSHVYCRLSKTPNWQNIQQFIRISHDGCDSLATSITCPSFFRFFGPGSIHRSPDGYLVISRPMFKSTQMPRQLIIMDGHGILSGEHIGLHIYNTFLSYLYIYTYHICI